MGYLKLVCGVIAIFLAIYYYLTSTFDFWKSRGIPSPQPILIFGTMNVLLGKQFMGDYLTDIYNEYKNESMIGIFFRTQPVLLIKSPELIKDVFIQELSLENFEIYFYTIFAK